MQCSAVLSIGWLVRGRRMHAGSHGVCCPPCRSLNRASAGSPLIPVPSRPAAPPPPPPAVDKVHQQRQQRPGFRIEEVELKEPPPGEPPTQQQRQGQKKKGAAGEAALPVAVAADGDDPGLLQVALLLPAAHGMHAAPNMLAAVTGAALLPHASSSLAPRPASPICR